MSGLFVNFPGIPDFAEVYSFIGSVFDPETKGHVQKLKEMDPINFETVSLQKLVFKAVLGNWIANSICFMLPFDLLSLKNWGCQIDGEMFSEAVCLATMLVV